MPRFTLKLHLGGGKTPCELTLRGSTVVDVQPRSSDPALYHLYRRDPLKARTD